jgi:hypothetical protein
VTTITTGARRPDNVDDVVVLIGDSLLNQSREAVDRVLRAYGWVPVIEARDGASLYGLGGLHWPERVRDLVRFTRPDAAVVELGTNGCGRCASRAKAINAIMGQLETVDRVGWLNVKEGAWLPPDPSAMNAQLRAAARLWPNLALWDLDAHFAGRPELLAGDGLHFSDAGILVFAAFIAERLGRAPGQ